MSASDKKQQRKAAMAEGLTQKQLKEQAEAQAAKKQRMIYIAIGIVCAVAAAALLIWNATDSMRDRAQMKEPAATVNGVEYSVADLRYYYSQARNNYYQYYSQFSAYGLNSYDPSVDDGAQWYNEAEGTTYADFFRESALSSLKQVAALCAEANAANFTASEEALEAVDDQLAEIDTTRMAYNLTRSAFFEQQYGITEDDFVRNLRNDILASEYSNHHEENISYDDAALDEYYKEHKDELDSYTYRSFLVDGAAPNPTDAEGNPVTDADGNTVTATDEEKAAAMAAAESKARTAAAEIQGAADKDAAFIEAAPKYVKENVKGSYEADPDYSLSSDVMGSTLTRNGSAIAEWLMDPDLQEGTVGVVESPNNGWFVVLFKGRKLDNDPTVDVRHILVSFETSDEDETDESGNKIPSQAEKDAAKTEAQALLDEWSGGEKTAESFGALAEEHSDDGRNSDGDLSAPGGEYTNVTKNYMVKPFNDWIFDSSRKEGDTGLVETSYGWHVIYFEGFNDPAWRHQAITSKQSNDQSEWLTEITDAMQANTADGMKYVGSANTATATPATPAPTAAAAE